jgi:hypothetical protein
VKKILFLLLAVTMLSVTGAAQQPNAEPETKSEILAYINVIDARVQAEAKATNESEFTEAFIRQLSDRDIREFKTGAIRMFNESF